MRPLPHADGHDAPWLADEVVPGEAAVVDHVVVGFEDPVGEPVVTHELPDILDRVEFGAARRQRQQGDVGRHDQFGRTVPSGLIEDEHGMGTGRHVEGDLFQMHAHRFTVAAGHDDAGGLAFSRTDRTKDPGRGSSLITRSRGTCAALGPAPGELGLLADPGFVLPPQLYGRSFREAFADLRQTGGEAFLKMAMSSSFCPR